MRFIAPVLIALAIAAPSFAQTSEISRYWISDEFSDSTLKPDWHTVAGTWTAEGDILSARGSADVLALLYNSYIMRTKPFMLDAVLTRAGGGVIFSAERIDRLADCHVVKVLAGRVSIGYFDFNGVYVEVRVVEGELNFPTHLRVVVDQKRHNFTVLIDERNVALEDLRYDSGFAGLLGESGGAAFQSFSVRGDGLPDPPAYFVKSNHMQLDDLSYMALKDEALIIANPVIGIVQRVTSVGTYVNELPLPAGALPRGVWVDENKWIYVVDAAQRSVRIFDPTNEQRSAITAGLEDPRAVVADAATVYVLDKNGIALFDKQGGSKGVKAAGLFKDPKGLFMEGNNLYVADFGNGQVQVLEKGSFNVLRVIKDQLVSPWGVCTDVGGHMYVADPGANAVFHYDGTGVFVERIDPITIKGFISPRAVLVRGDMVYVGDFDRILGFRKGVLTIRPSQTINN